MVSNQKWLSIAEHKQCWPLNLCEPSFTGANERALCLRRQMTDVRLKISLLHEPLSYQHPLSDQIKKERNRLQNAKYKQSGIPPWRHQWGSEGCIFASKCSLLQQSALTWYLKPVAPDRPSWVSEPPWITQLKGIRRQTQTQTHMSIQRPQTKAR